MVRNKLIIKGIAASILYCLLGIIFDCIDNNLAITSIIENIGEGIAFGLFMYWLLKSDNVRSRSKYKINPLGSFFIGFFGSCLFLTLLLFLKIGYVSMDFYKSNFSIISTIYLISGFVGGGAVCFLSYVYKHRKE